MSLHAKAHTFASRARPSTDQILQKSVLFANPKRIAKKSRAPMKTSNMRVNSFFSSLPSVFYFFATHNRHKNSWTETAKTHTGQGLTMTEDRRPACNSVYVAIAGEVVNRRSVLLKNFVLNGKESTSNPLLHIHANRCAAYKNPPHKQHIWFLPTHKANAKKTKRAVFCQRSKICIL